MNEVFEKYFWSTTPQFAWEALWKTTETDNMVNCRHLRKNSRKLVVYIFPFHYGLYL
jgi:hypothetical protein